MRAPLVLAAMLTALAAAPARAEDAPAVAVPETPAITYLGIETILLDTDLVSFRLALKGAKDAAAIDAYARCAAAQYTLIRGYGFARHLRTNVAQKGNQWLGDAVFTISAGLPRGESTIDAKAVAAECAGRGIPTV